MVYIPYSPQYLQVHWTQMNVAVVVFVSHRTAADHIIFLAKGVSRQQHWDVKLVINLCLILPHLIHCGNVVLFWPFSPYLSVLLPNLCQPFLEMLANFIIESHTQLTATVIILINHQLIDENKVLFIKPLLKKCQVEFSNLWLRILTLHDSQPWYPLFKCSLKYPCNLYSYSRFGFCFKASSRPRGSMLALAVGLEGLE